MMSLQNLTGDPLVVASVRETYCRVVTDPTAVDMLVTDSTVAFNIAASITSKLLPSSILDAQPGSVRLRLRDDSGAASANPITLVGNGASGRTATAWTTVWTIPVATILAEAWGANLIGPAAKIQKTAGTTSVRALVDRFQWSDPNS